MAHTTGKWEIVYNTPSNQKRRGFLIIADQKNIASIIPAINIPDEELWGNAKVIMLAPAMLKSIRNVIKYSDDVKDQYKLPESLILELKNLVNISYETR